MLNEATQFSFLPLQKLLKSSADDLLLSKIEKEFNLNPNIIKGQQKVPTTLLTKIFLYCETQNFPGIAFHYGLTSESGSLGLLDYYLASCETLEKSIHELICYFPLIAFRTIHAEVLVNTKHQLQFEILSNSTDSNQQRIFKELVFARIVALISRLSNHQWPQKIQLPQQSFSKSIYEQLTTLGIDVDFNSKHFQMLLHKQQHLRPLPFKNLRTINILKPELQQLLDEDRDSDSIIVEIIAIFSSEKDIAAINQGAVAEKLNQSESSLKRKIAEANSSFSKILSSYKREKAIILLTKQNLNIDKITQILGYTDRSSFERAFKLWTNLTPVQFIQQSSLLQISLENIKADDINSLPASPKICQQIFELTKSDNFEIPQLSSLVKTDPILTGKLMSIANSAYYGGNKVSDINQAIIQVLGVDVVQNMVFSLMSCNQLKIKNCPEFKLQYFWFQSLFTAESVKLISNHEKIKLRITPSELYLAALLHKIGDYVLAYLKPKIMNRFLNFEKQYQDFEQNQNQHYQDQLLQQKVFGLSSETIGALLLTHWGLPKSVSSLIREMGSPFEQQSLVAKILTLMSLFSEHQIYDHNTEDIPHSFVQQLSEILAVENRVLNKSLVKIVNNYDSVQSIASEITKVE